MKRLTILALVLITLSGCFLKSVHPLVTQDDAIIVDGLQGRWQDDDQRWTFINNPNEIPELSFSGINYEGTFNFSANEGDTIEVNAPFYLILIEDLEKNIPDTTLFLGAVGMIDDQLYLDLSLLECCQSTTEMESIHLLPVHTFSRLNIFDGRIEIEFFKDSWISELIRDNQVRIKHEKTGEDILITASTSELKKFVEKYSEDEEAFENPAKLERVD